MRVLIVCSYKPNMQDGCVPFIREQVEALRAQGCECEYYHIKGKGLLGYMREISGLRKKVREYKPDVVHAHYGLSCLVANLATWRVPVVSTYHGSDINVKSVLRFSKLAIRLSAWNIFVSKRNMSQAGAVEGKKASLVPCGVNLPQPWSELKNQKVEQMTLNQWVEGVLGVRAESREPRVKRFVLFAGAFDNAVKDPELAKAAVAYLNEKINTQNTACADINIEDISKPKMNHPQSLNNDSPSIDPKSAHMQASGQPSAQSCANFLPDDSEKKSDFQSLQKNTKNTIELIELKGYTRDQVNALMYSCDALLMTSKTEGSPQVVKEAMACGCPIVSTDVGDVKERVAGVEGCYVVKSREPREIAEALEMAVAFEGKTNGREKILEYGLTNELVAKKIIKIYGDIIKQ